MIKSFFKKGTAGFLNLSFYFKLITLYSIFILIVFLSSTFILLNYLNSNLEKEIKKSNQMLLTQVQIFSDLYLLGKVNSFVTEKFLDLSSNKFLMDFYYSPRYASTDLPYQVSIILSNFARSDQYISSVYIYAGANDTLVSSREGVILSASDSGNPYRDSFNIELIRQAMTSPAGRRWVSPKDNMRFWNNRSIISYVQSIPIFSDVTSRLGCCIINIDADSFLKSIQGIVGTSSGDFMIIDAAGNELVYSGQMKLSETAEYKNDFDAILSTRSGFTVINHHGTRIAASWLKSSVNDWKYISFVPIDSLNKPLYVIKQFALLIAGFIIIFSLLGVNVIASWLLKPLNRLIKFTKNQYAFDHKKSDIEFINDVISNLSHQVSEMTAAVKDHRNIITYKLVMDLIQDHIKDDNELLKRLKLIDIDFAHSRYAVIFIEINSKLFNQLNFEQKEYLSIRAHALANHFLSARCRLINICNPSNCIINIINFDDYGPVLMSLGDLLDALHAEIGLSCNITASKPADSTNQLRSLYNTTLGYAKYQFIYGFGNIFTFATIDRYETGNRHFDQEGLSEVEFLLRACKTEEVKDRISEAVKAVKMNGYSYDYVQSMLFELIRLISVISHEQSIRYDTLEKTVLMADFRSISTLDECQQWIFGILDIFKTGILRRNSCIDQEFIAKITVYIENNIDRQISLQLVADEFNMSTGHLSRVFKECLGMNFSDFVINKKFETAAKLLLASNKLEVSQIAERLGYASPSYFINLFKERYGMTPMQYRKKHAG